MSGSNDQSIIFWDPYKGVSTAAIWEADDTGVTCVKWLGGMYLASGGKDQRIRIWELATFTMVRRLNGHSGSITALEILSNGLLASVATDRTLKSWNVNTAICLTSIATPASYQVNAMKQLPNDLIALTGSFEVMYFVNMTSQSMTSMWLVNSTTSRQMVLLNDSVTLVVANSIGLGLVVDLNAQQVSSNIDTGTTYEIYSLEQFYRNN